MRTCSSLVVLLLVAGGGCAADRRLDALDLLYRTGDVETALAGYELYLEADPDHPRALHGRALSLYTLGRYEEALPPIERLVAIVPDDADYREIHGDCLAQLARYPAAVEAYEAALKLQSWRSRTYYKIGIAYLNEKRYEKAAGFLEEYLRREPEAADAESVRQLVRHLEQ